MTLRTNVAFRRLLGGRLVTNAGDSLYLIATMWLVHDLTGSTTFTSIAGFLLLLPTALQFLFGPLVDRRSIRKLLVGTQVVQAGVVVIIPLAWATGYLTVWVLLAVVPILALLNQIVYPALNTALPRIVDDADLVPANSAFAIAYQGVDMVFNAIGGLLIALVGVVGLFLVDAVTFLVAATLFATVRIPRPEAPARGPTHDATDGERPLEGGNTTIVDGGERMVSGTDSTNPVDDDGYQSPRSDERLDRPFLDAPAEGPIPDTLENGSYLDELGVGFSYFWGTVLWRMTLAVFIGVATFWATMVTLPAFADERGGPVLYGFLMAAIAGGVLAGFLVAPWLKDRRFGYVMLALHPIGAAAWFAAIRIERPGWTIALFAVAVVLMGVNAVSTRTIIQRVVPDHLLGRVTALNASIMGIAAPLGALLGGAVAQVFGVTIGAAMLGVGIVAVGTLFLLDAELRQLPAVTAVTATDLGLEPVDG